MLGSKSSYKFFGPMAWGLGFFLAPPSFAHVPAPGQIARFQPGLLRNEKPFIVKGSFAVAGQSIESLIKWQGPGTYEVVLANLPKSFSKLDGSSQNSLVLSRERSGACALKVHGVVINCSKPNFWAMLELSGQPDLTAKSLVEPGLYSASDSQWVESDSRTVMPDAKNTRVKLGVGKNNQTPIAVLQIFGPSADANDESPTPLIHFDQTFLSPLFARFSSKEGLVTLTASSDLDVRRNRSRFTHILASRIVVALDTQELAVIKRQEASEAPKMQPLSKVPSATSELSSLSNLLSPEGERLVQALLLTH